MKYEKQIQDVLRKERLLLHLPFDNKLRIKYNEQIKALVLLQKKEEFEISMMGTEKD